jgi:type IV secretory pathway VirB4 component
MESLHSKKLTKPTSSLATQQFVNVSEVKEDVIVLKNGSLRAVLAVSAINFDLKSTDEQTAIIDQYQNFLNSLDFPIQIIISSRKININHYIEFIEKKEKQQENTLLKMQISEYKNFIRQLVSVSDIMEKNFYIIVPFAPVENVKKSSLGNLFDMLNPKQAVLDQRENFETYKNQLFQRLDHISSALSGIGLRLTPLKTQEIIELLYNSYNPNLFIDSELGDVNKMEIS